MEPIRFTSEPDLQEQSHDDLHDRYGLPHRARANGLVGQRRRHAWTYDANGNRLSETRNGVASAYAYPTGSNRLASIALADASWPYRPSVFVVIRISDSGDTRISWM